jgi:hypothetical protein
MKDSGNSQLEGRQRAQRSRFAIAALLASAGFVFLASLHLEWLGPYYDEWIFVPVSLRFLGGAVSTLKRNTPTERRGPGDVA